MGNWDRKGPLPDAPSRGGARDFGDRERRPRDPAFESRPQREFTWERHGPLAPLSPQEGSGSRDGSRPRASPDVQGDRSESFRGNRRDSPAWGEAREGGSRPRPERPERTATAAEKDMQWRDRMRPDAAKPTSPDASAPPSPALSNAPTAQGGRPRLNLTKRTVSEAPDASSNSGADSKASPFGAARPIDTAAREKEIEVKRQQAIQEKREADEKAKEEKRLAKEAAAKAEAEAEAKAEADAAQAKEDAAAAETKEAAETTEESAEPKAETANDEQKVPVRNREPRDAPKSRANEASSWRSSGNDRGPRGGAGPRGGRGGRGGGMREARAGPLRSNGAAPQQASASPDAEPATPTADDDGWTTVPNKKGRQGRAMGP